MRKVVGAYKHQLIGQFMVEAAFVNFFSILIAWVLTLLALPSFNALSRLSLEISYLLQPWFLALLLMLWVIGTLLSGFYPA